MITLHEHDGRVTFEFFRAGARSVHLAGSFNEWSTVDHPMEPTGDGTWKTTIDVQPGDHIFQYVVDGHAWFADFAAHGVGMNEFGGWESYLTVPSVDPARHRQLELLTVVEGRDDRLSPLPFQADDEDELSRDTSTKRAA